MRFNAYGDAVYPGDRDYSSSGGDVDRYDNERFDEWIRHNWNELSRQHDLSKGVNPGSKLGSDTLQPADLPMS